jgi:hypothetical protein
MKVIIIFFILFNFSYSDSIFSKNQNITKTVNIINKNDKSLNISFNINSIYKIKNDKGFFESNLNVMNTKYKINIDFIFSEEFNIEKVYVYWINHKNKKQEITCKNNGINLSFFNFICSNGINLTINKESEKPLVYNVSNRDLNGKIKIYNIENKINDIKIYLENSKYILMVN